MTTSARITIDEWNLLIAIASLFVNSLTAIVACVLAFVTFRLSHRMARNDLLFEVRSWGDEVVNLLSRATTLCEIKPERDAIGFFQGRYNLIHESSALWDRGRFFFPNFYKEIVGTDKPGAFRGIKPEILNLMELVHGLARSIDYSSWEANKNRRTAFVLVKRYFVSIIQEAVDFRTAPSNAAEYEAYLGGLRVPALPAWVKSEVRVDPE